MLETYPVPPLLPGHALAIGVTSYDGGVYYGITADRDALPDVDVLGQCVTEALDELRRQRQRRPDPARPRGRKKAVEEADEHPCLRPDHARRPGRLRARGRHRPSAADAASQAADESEEAEYAALMAAADDVRASCSTGPGRRVVVVAETVATRPGVVALRLVVAVHVDTEDDADPDADLAWYATQEIADLLPEV